MRVKIFVSTDGKNLGGPNRVLDLPAVELYLHNLILKYVITPPGIRTRCSLFDEGKPEVATRFHTQLWGLNHHVDARLDYFVKSAGSIDR